LREDPAQISVADRLGSTLFVATLLHGIVIFGVTFTVGPLGQTDAVPTLKVTLVADTRELQEASENADYLAQRNQRGSGEREVDDRPTTALSADQPLTQQGDPFGADLDDGTPRELIPSTEQLVTRDASEQRLNALPETNEEPATQPQTAATLVQQTAEQTLAAEVNVTATLPQQEDRELPASPDTRESALAVYLSEWRRRVEQIGTVNFPDRARDGRATENPTLEVAIGPEGQLEDIVLRRSSGDSVLDQAALTILRMAAPFEPLPQTIRAEYDVLRFAYDWDFDGGQPRFRPDAGLVRD